MEILGRGFSPDPERNAVFFGATRAKVLKASEDKLIARIGAIGASERAKLLVAVDGDDIFTPIFSCRATRRRPIFIGLVVLVSDVFVQLKASEGVKKLGERKYDARLGALVLNVPRKEWNPNQT